MKGLHGTKLRQIDEDLDIERERSINEKMKAYFAEKEKPIDIMGAAKKPCSGTEGEDYRYYDSTGRHR